MDAGTQLGPYEIKEPLGKGGMGEVYRARDARLDRDVAIKLLPAELTDEPQRLSRLEREARLLASLNHPNIGSIYGLEETDKGRPALVLELVEGPTLADRISRGPLPVEEALPIILQIAEALEAAHESGIIHRDLKPANVKITLEGQAKVLDFGLAKALEPERDEQELSDSPTLSAAATRTGLILGTAGYMSPEQAKGKSVDRRADIWAFGVVLLEMLTGERTFGGETVSDTLASVIKDDPDLGRLPVGVPLSVRRVLDRCLRKDPAERFHDIADVRLLLEDAPEATTEERDHGWMWPRSSRGAGLAAGLAVVGVLVGVAGMLLLDRGEPTGPPEVPARRFVIEYGDLREGRPALSPDGRRLAYAKDGRIWVRDLDRLEKLPVPGTEGGSVPFWSPDGEWIGFSSGSDTSGSEGSIWKVRPDGTGRTMITTPAPTTLAGGAAWLPDGRIVFNTGRGELLVVPDRGGEATPFAPLGEGEADYHYVAALPDGRGVLTALHRGDRWNSIQLVTLDGERREIATFSRHNVGALAYSPTGHIVFERGVVLLQGGLWAVPFSIEELEVTGEPFPVATGGGAPAIAGDGTLVYVVTQPPVDAELVLVHPTGEVLSRVGEPRRGLY
ncbi:MAG: protein kinase domain-containing protein, partial [Acidobacteriota bacterium]